jgi:hypothetical protein
MRWAAGAILFLWIVSAGCSSESPQTTDLEKRKKEFAASMTNVVLDGAFTVSREGETRLREEKYTIESVSELAGDLWVFQARIQYGDHDVTVPVPVKVHWADDTPVVSLTDATIPGLGTFTARVLFYRDHYAGFWQHGETTGNQFGRIVRGGQDAPAPDTSNESPAGG